MMDKLTPAQRQQRMDRWRHIREISDLGRRFKRTRPLLTGDDLGKQTFMPLDESHADADVRRLEATISAAKTVLPRAVFTRAFFEGVDAVSDPRTREILALKAQMEEILCKTFERQQQPKPG